jgi:phenylacetate-CoA ligase
VHPVAFHQVLDLLDAVGWQARQDGRRLQVLIAPLLSASIRLPPNTRSGPASAAAGADRAAMQVSTVDQIPAGAAGQAPARRRGPDRGPARDADRRGYCRQSFVEPSWFGGGELHRDAEPRE